MTGPRWKGKKASELLLLLIALAAVPLAGATTTAGDDATAPPVVEGKGCDFPKDSVEAGSAFAAGNGGDVNTLLHELHAIFRDLPGFVDVYYFEGLDVEFRPMFVREVPSEAYDRETPVEVAFDVTPTEPQPVSGPGLLPDVGDIRCTGIRPGTRIISPTGICTLNFVFTNSTNTTFVGTAGHCTEVGDQIAANIGGIGSAPIIGTTVFSTGDGGVGDDFALIEVDSGWVGFVTPEMCDVAGPTGAFSGSGILGEPTVQTGHGGGLVAAPPRPKPGVGLGWGATSFTWVGGSIPGDSGSGIRLLSGDALGTVTHLSLLVPVMNFGTTWDHGVSLAAADGFTGLTLATVNWTHP